jgi:hypothetical protein
MPSLYLFEQANVYRWGRAVSKTAAGKTCGTYKSYRFFYTRVGKAHVLINELFWEEFS